MRLKTKKSIFKLLGISTFLFLLILKEAFTKPAFAQSTNRCALSPECIAALSSEVAPVVATPTAEAGGSIAISATTATGVTTTAEAVAPVALGGDIRLSGVVAYYLWNRGQNGQAQQKAAERYCAAYPGDEVCNSTVVRRSFVEGYAWVGCSTPTFRSLPIPEGQENNITSQATSYCGPGGQLAYYKSGSRFDDTVFKGGFSIVTKDISTMWAVEGYAWVGCSTPTFRSLPIPEGQENNITSQATSYCGPGGQLAYYSTGNRFDDTVFKGSFSIVNKNIPIPWKDWPQEKRSIAVAALQNSDWQGFVNSMPEGGRLNPGDTVKADGGVIIPGQEQDDPNTPADERILRKEPGFFTNPGGPDTDFDKDGTPDSADPEPQNPNVPTASSNPPSPEPTPTPSPSPEPSGNVGYTSERESPLYSELTNELRSNGTKFIEANIVCIGRDETGKVVWLETGNDRAGLQHIVTEHKQNFEDAGISENQIPEAVIAAVTTGKIVGIQPTDRPIYEVTFNGKTQYIAVTVGSNGFIVGANPKSQSYSP